MTTAHVAALFFDQRAEAAKKRLQALKRAGLIAERPRLPNRPAVLFLAGPGLRVLHSEGILSEFPPLDLSTLERRAQVGDFTVRHELEVMDVKIALYSALSDSSHFSLFEFSTWPILYQFEATSPAHPSRKILVKPDAYIRIDAPGSERSPTEHSFFLELDRSTEALDTLVRKAGSYLAYYRSGGFAIRNGSVRSRFREFPFRALFVLKSTGRRNILAERLLSHSPRILSMAYLTTLEELGRDPLGSIWIRPLDLRNALQDSDHRPASGKYRHPSHRQTRRDAVIESRIVKQRLL